MGGGIWSKIEGWRCEEEGATDGAKKRDECLWRHGGEGKTKIGEKRGGGGIKTDKSGGERGCKEKVKYNSKE